MTSDPTELAGIAEASTEMVEAWSLDEEDAPDESRFGAWAITACGVAASLLAVAGAGWLVVNRVPAPGTSVVKVVERTTISQVAPPAAQPPPVTVTAAPKLVPVPKRDPDTQLLSEMRNAGWRIDVPDNIVTYAHWYCDGLAKGLAPASMQLTIIQHANGEMNEAGAEEFASRVTRIYGC